MVQDDSHSTLRDSADSISRRAGSIAMTGLAGLEESTNLNPAPPPGFLNFSRYTDDY
jgi:hypothetical protein